MTNIVHIQLGGLRKAHSIDWSRENFGGNGASPKAGDLASDYREGSSEVKLKIINAEDLRKEAKAGDRPSLEFLPLLGQEGFFVKGWSHILAGYPKVGKTELIIRSVSEWRGERILFFTEEPESLWRARLESLPDIYGLEHVEVCFALGVKPSEILKEVKDGDESVVVIDTVRSLLGIEDETDNSEVSRAMIPFIAAAREKGKTIIFGHHERKSGGSHGKGITGGHAFLGVVDIATELDWANSKRKRRLRGWGRIIEVPELVYEKLDDGRMVALGSPKAVGLKNVKKSALGVLDHEWKKTKEVKGMLADSKPSDDQVLKALEELAKEGTIERVPEIGLSKKQGVTYRWRLASKEKV